MFYRRKKSFFSSSNNSSGSFNLFRFKKAINKKRIEKPFSLKKENNKLIDKINKKESKISFFIKTILSSLIGIISLTYLVKIISDLFKDEYLQLDTFFLFSGFLLMSLFVTLFSIKRFFSKKKEGLKSFSKMINMSIVFLFASIIITTIKNPTNYLNEVKPEDLISVQIKPKEIRLSSSKYSKIYIDTYNYPSFYFKIKNIYQFDYTEFVNNTNENDILNIRITKKDLNRKLNNKEKLTFWDKHFKYDDILVYELSKNGKELIEYTQTKISTSKTISLISLVVFNGMLTISSVILILDIFNIKLKTPFTILRTKIF